MATSKPIEAWQLIQIEAPATRQYTINIQIFASSESVNSPGAAVAFGLMTGPLQNPSGWLCVHVCIVLLHILIIPHDWYHQHQQYHQYRKHECLSRFASSCSWNGNSWMGLHQQWHSHWLAPSMCWCHHLIDFLEFVLINIAWTHWYLETVNFQNSQNPIISLSENRRDRKRWLGGISRENWQVGERISMRVDLEKKTLEFLRVSACVGCWHLG